MIDWYVVGASAGISIAITLSWWHGYMTGFRASMKKVSHEIEAKLVEVANRK